MFKLLFIALLFAGGQEPQVQSPNMLISKGDSLLAVGRALKAVAFYDKAIKAGSRADGYSARAKAWYELDRMDRFILDVETALDFNRTHPYAQFQRALYAMRSRDWSLAKTSCDRSLNGGIEPKMVPQVRILRGEAHAKLGNIESAIDDLKAGCEGGEVDIEAMRLLASLYNDVELHESAIEIITKALQLKDADNGDRINLGYQKALLGLHEEAIKEYKVVLLDDKNNAIALSNFAYSLYKLGRNEDAFAMVKKSLRAHPGNPFALRTRGLLYLSKGETEKACKDLFAAKIGGDFKNIDKLIERNCVGIKR